MLPMRRLTSLAATLAAMVPLLSDPLVAAEDSPSNQPQYGKWGFDLAGADLSTKPGDNFFRYANGTWIDKTQIPPDKPAYSLRLAMTDLTEQRLHQLMESLAPSEAPKAGSAASLEQKVGAFYQSFMDEARIEQLGAQAIQGELDEIRKAKTRDELTALMGRTNTDFPFSLFNYGIDVDLKDPSRYAFYLTQAGLGLPDRDYYLKPDFAPQKTVYTKYVATLLSLVNWPEPEARAKDVVDFETKIAEASWTKAQQRDLVAIYNPMSVDELTKFTPGFAWKEFRERADAEAFASDRRREKRLPETNCGICQGSARGDSGVARLSPRR